MMGEIGCSLLLGGLRRFRLAGVILMGMMYIEGGL